MSAVSVTAAPDASARPGVDRRAMAALSAGHLFTDVSQGAIPALLPFLIARDHLNYASASALILAATIASSVIQPLFGHISDRRSLPWLMPIGPVLGGIGVGLVGIAPNYALTFAAVLLSGFGVAAFHPEASRFANYVSGQRRSSGMSLFSVGGNVGFALGPVLVTPLVLAFGLSGTLLVIIPTSLMGARARPRAPAPDDVPVRSDGGPRPARRPAGCVGAVRAPGRGHRAALVRLLRLCDLHPAVLHPRSAHRQGDRLRGADGDAGRRGGRHVARGPARRSLRAPRRCCGPRC